LGVAGVGKSRLVGEFLRGVDATVVRGRCLSYGEGITYWPVVEAAKQLRPEESELDARVGGPLAALRAGDGAASRGEAAWAGPRIQALLSARLDQLPRAERAALERGSVEGQVFHGSAVQALAPEDSRVPSSLLGLVRKELVRPERAQLSGDDAFRFRHILIRD